MHSFSVDLILYCILNLFWMDEWTEMLEKVVPRFALITGDSGKNKIDPASI